MTPRQLNIDEQKCIGCWACARNCAPGLITVADAGAERRIVFPGGCGEECSACAQVCPTGAVTLEAVAAAASGPRALAFELSGCQKCGELFTTEKIRLRLEGQLGALISAAGQGEDWTTICPSCREMAAAEAMGRQAVLRRWPGQVDGGND